MSEKKIAKPDHPIHELIQRRWSPYAFSDQAVADSDLQSLLEAARWAASSYNEQPWNFLIALKKNQEQFDKMLSCLVEPNQVWAKAAPVLMLCAVRKTFSRNGKTNSAAVHDLGLAMATMTLEATSRGLFVHQMIGIKPDRAQELYQVPDDAQVVTGVAIGHVGDPQSLPEEIQGRDQGERPRKPLSEFVHMDSWGSSASFVSN